MFRMRINPNGYSRMRKGEEVFTYRSVFLVLPIVLASLCCLAILPSYESLSRGVMVLIAAASGIVFVFASLFVLIDFGFLLPIEAVNDSVKRLEAFEEILKLLGSKASSARGRIEDLLAVEAELSDLEHRLPPIKRQEEQRKGGRKKAKKGRRAKPPTLAERLESISAELLAFRATKKGDESEYQKEVARLTEELRLGNSVQAKIASEHQGVVERLERADADVRTLQEEKRNLQRQIAKIHSERAGRIERLEQLERDLAEALEKLEQERSDAHARREELRREFRAATAQSAETQRLALAELEAKLATKEQGEAEQVRALRTTFELELQKRDVTIAELEGQVASVTAELKAARIRRLDLSERFSIELEALREIELSRHCNSVLRRNISSLNELLEIFSTRLFVASLLAEEGKWEWVQTLCLPARVPDCLGEILADVPQEVLSYAELRLGISSS